MASDISVKLTLDGEQSFRTALTAINSQIKNLGSELDSVTADMAGVDRAETATAQKTAALGRAIEATKQKVALISAEYDKQKTKLTQLAQELERLENAEEKDAGAIAKATDAYNRQAITVNRLGTQVNRAERDLRGLETEMERVAAEANEAGGAVDRMGREMDGAGGRVAKLGEILKGTFAANLASKGVDLAVSGVKRAISGVINVGREFSGSMSQVAATMGITVDEISVGSEAFNLLGEAARRAGASTPFSASQAADALNYLALAGYDAARAAEVLPTVLNLAAAGSMELAEASDMATDAMAALGIEATGRNLSEFGDKLAATATKANASVAQLGEAILTVGGTANVLAGGTTELSAALGIFANAGIKGSEAGTALRNIVLSLTAPTDKASAEMRRLGVSAVDSAGNFRPLNEVFSDLNAALAAMGDSEKTQVLNSIFNKTDLAAVQALLAGAGEEFSALATAIDASGGAMERMAATMQDNLGGDLNALNSALEATAETIYTKLEPYIRKAIQWVIDLVRDLPALVDTLAEVAPVIAAVGAALSALAVTMKIVNVVMAANPITIVIALLASLAAMLVAAYTTSEEFRNTVKNAFDGAKNAVSSAIAGIKSFLTSLVTAVGLVVGAFKAFPREIRAVFSEALSVVSTWGNNVKMSVVGAATTAVQSAIDGFRRLPREMRALLAEAASAVVAWGQNVASRAATAGRNIVSRITGALQGLPDQLVTIGANAINGLLRGLTGAAQRVYEKCREIANRVKATLQNALGIASPAKELIPVGEMIMAGVAVGIGSGFAAVKEKINSVTERLLRVEARAAERLHGVWAASSVGAALVAQLNAVTSARAEYEKQLNEIASAEASFAEKLSNTGALFERAKDEEGNDVFSLADMRAQAQAVRRFGVLLDNLKIRAGSADGLIETVLGMNLEDATDYMEALLSMTEAELNEYISLWTWKRSQAEHEAEKHYLQARRALEKFIKGVVPEDGQAQGWSYARHIADGLRRGVLSVEDAAGQIVERLKVAAAQMADALKNAALTDSIRDSLQEQLDFIEKVTKEYSDAIAEIEKSQESLAGKMRDYGALFEKVETRFGEKYVATDLRAQIAALEDYGGALEALRARGVEDSLLNEVLSMGIDDARGYVGALMRLTDSQYEEYMKLWTQKQQAADEIAKNFYRGQLEDLSAEFIDRLPEELGGVRGELRSVGVDSVKGLIEGMRSQRDALTAAAVGIVKSAVSEMKKAAGIHSPSKLTANAIGFPMADGIVQGLMDGLASRAGVIAAAVTRPIERLSGADVNRAAAATVNGISSVLPGGGPQGGQYIVQLLLDGRQIAEAQFEPLRQVARARGAEAIS